jgi:hypothetical protein
MFGLLLKQLVLPVAFEAVKIYINNSSSKKDDKVLELVQSGAEYLAQKPNNTLSQNEAQILKHAQMTKIQGR